MKRKSDHAAAPSLEPKIAKPSLRDLAYETIRNRIAQGELNPGAVLSPRKLGEELGMSFLPVAEALKLLELQGLVESKDRVGSRVKIPTKDDVNVLCMIREALESQVARLAAQRATPRELDQMIRRAIEVDARCRREPTSAKSWAKSRTTHTQFHRFVAECAHCEALLRAIESTNVFTLKVLFEGVMKRKVRPAKISRELRADHCNGQPRGGRSGHAGSSGLRNERMAGCRGIP